jgi:uroporphyrinogen-III synthase
MNRLRGKRILVTRPLQQSNAFSERLAAIGAVPVLFPTIAIVPDQDQLIRLDQALHEIDRFDWLVFTSQNAVKLFCDRYENIYTNVEALEHMRIAAVGPATALVLNERGIPVEAMPDEYVGDAIAGVMGDVQGKRILIPHAQAARAILVKELIRKGASINEIQLYRSMTSQPEQSGWDEMEKGVDYITFTSASTVRGFFELLGDRAVSVLRSAVTACIGPVTASQLEDYGVKAQVTAPEYTIDGLVQALLTYEEENAHGESV